MLTGMGNSNYIRMGKGDWSRTRTTALSKAERGQKILSERDGRKKREGLFSRGECILADGVAGGKNY